MKQPVCIAGVMLNFAQNYHTKTAHIQADQNGNKQQKIPTSRNAKKRTRSRGSSIFMQQEL
ncbi:MAG TPA: hypothetical protein VEY70_26130 [Metabacillus sp.]|nr:hypothetical protein [Metabacillus sp.]